jgi:excisionase family DNA binding protein
VTAAARLEGLVGPVLAGAILDALREELAGSTIVDSPKRWLSVNEAGEYLGCSAKAVYARIDRGRIPATAVRRMGRTVAIDRHALDTTLERY